MVYWHLQRFRACVPLLTKQVTSHFRYKKLSTNLRTMEAVRTLKDLGYAFNNGGELRKLDERGEITDQPFQFNVSENHQECQARYEELGNAITPYIYHLCNTF